MPDTDSIPTTVKPTGVPGRVSPDEALQRLREGNRRYAANEASARDFMHGRAERAAKQYPFAAILSCADSRVAPELAFDQGPGDLFVVRVAGNFVNVDGLASLEYAVEFLNVGLIVVLGHENCGAVDAAIKVARDGAQLPGELPALVSHIKPHVAGAFDDLHGAIAANVQAQVRRLREAGPLIGPRVAAGEVEVAGAVYDLHTGTIAWL